MKGKRENWQLFDQQSETVSVQANGLCLREVLSQDLSSLEAESKTGQSPNNYANKAVWIIFLLGAGWERDSCSRTNIND